MYSFTTSDVALPGHEARGAVSATIKSVKDGAALPGHMPKLVDTLAPAAKAAPSAPGDLLTNATNRNVQFYVEHPRAAREIAILRPQTGRR